MTQTLPAEAQPPTRRRRGVAVAMAAGIAVSGLAAASAASLGGITAQTLGADVSVISSCDTDGVTVATTNAYDAATGAYKVGTVSVTGINAACNSKAISLTLKDAAGASLGAGSSTVSAGAASFSLSPTADAKSVVGVAVVISG